MSRDLIFITFLLVAAAVEAGLWFFGGQHPVMMFGAGWCAALAFAAGTDMAIKRWFRP